MGVKRCARTVIVRDGHAVELRGVEDRILPQDEALLRLAGLGVLVVIDLPEHDGTPRSPLRTLPPAV